VLGHPGGGVQAGLVGSGGVAKVDTTFWSGGVLQDSRFGGVLTKVDNDILSSGLVVVRLSGESMGSSSAFASALARL